jgi:hypothetical protein
MTKPTSQDLRCRHLTSSQSGEIAATAYGFAFVDPEAVLAFYQQRRDGNAPKLDPMTDTAFNRSRQFLRDFAEQAPCRCPCCNADITPTTPGQVPFELFVVVPSVNKKAPGFVNGLCRVCSEKPLSVKQDAACAGMARMGIVLQPMQTGRA